MKIKPRAYRPDVAIPPGATIREMLNDLGMSQAELAERMGHSVDEVHEIVEGEQPTVAETAVKLANTLGLPVGFWLQLESNYQLTKIRLSLKTADAESEKEGVRRYGESSSSSVR